MSDQHERYDAIIIGTGQAGKPLARALGRAGKKTAIIEKRHVGGTCINVGCTPTKTMVASARIAYLMGRSADYGVETGEFHVDLGKVLERKRRVVEQFRNGSRQALEETAGVDLIFGEARFTGPSSVAVHREDAEVRHLEAGQIFINTGTRSAVPRIDGIEDVPVLDNETMLELDTIPEHLIVVGGGYIGVEFGQMFRRFGARVTIVQRGAQLLSREDEDVAKELAEVFSDEGIDVVFNANAQRVDEDSAGGVVLTIETPAGSQQLRGSHLLAAIGRTPTTDALQLDIAGVDTGARNYIVVNGRLETTAPGIWALGDVKGGPQFTHIAYDDYRVIEANLLGDGDATIEERLVPYTVFTDPELGRIGLSEKEATALDLDYRVAKLPMARVARAIERSETRGFMKAIVENDTDRILGCAILGIEGGEVMSVVQVAMMGGLPYTALRDGVFAHPTVAESLNNLFLAMDAQ